MGSVQHKNATNIIRKYADKSRITSRPQYARLEIACRGSSQVASATTSRGQNQPASASHDCRIIFVLNSLH